MRSYRPVQGLRFAALSALVLLGMVGCSSQPIYVDRPLDPTHERLIQIGIAYSRFLANQHKPPHTVADLRPLLAEWGNVDDLLRSARDGQPLVICWDVDSSGPLPWAKNTPVLAYEKQGAGGSRYVLTAVHSVELLSDKDFREASFPPGHHPAW